MRGGGLALRGSGRAPPLTAPCFRLSVQQEQHQALIYQLMQQQHDLQQLQHLSSSQLPVNSLLPTAQGAIAANPFLTMHTEASQKNAVSNSRTPPHSASIPSALNAMMDSRERECILSAAVFLPTAPGRDGRRGHRPGEKLTELGVSP